MTSLHLVGIILVLLLLNVIALAYHGPVNETAAKCFRQQPARAFDMAKYRACLGTATDSEELRKEGERDLRHFVTGRPVDGWPR